MSIWYLLHTREDDSLCTVHEKNLMRAGSTVHIGEDVKFFYKGEAFHGKVLFKSMDQAEVNAQFDAKKKEFRHKRSSGPRNESQPKIKRSKPPKKASVSEEEKTRRRIYELNKLEAAKRSNVQVLQRIRGQDDDGPYSPDNDDDEQSNYNSDTGSDSDECLSSLAQKKQGDNLVKELRDVSNTPKPSERDGPSKEDLLDQVAILKVKLRDAMSGSSKRRILTTDSSPGSSNSLMEGSKRNNLENVLAGIDNFHDETGFVADPSSKDDLDDVELDLDDCSTYGLGDQLYGESRDTKLLAKNIYCKVDVLTKALASATNLNSLVRRLLPGVFIPSKVLDCTVTGQSWRAGGAEVAAIQKTPLHPVALQAILDFAFAVAKKKHWSATRRLAKLKPVITRRLIEMKNQFRKGTLRD